MMNREVRQMLTIQKFLVLWDLFFLLLFLEGNNHLKLLENVM